MHARAWTAASVLLVAGVLYASLAPLNLQANLPTHFDKLQHALAYVCLTVWFTGFVTRPRYWLIALALTAFGLAVEFLQASMPFGRQGDPLDLVSNVGGIAAGIAIASWATGGWAARVETWLSRN